MNKVLYDICRGEDTAQLSDIRLSQKSLKLWELGLKIRNEQFKGLAGLEAFANLNFPSNKLGDVTTYPDLGMLFSEKIFSHLSEYFKDSPLVIPVNLSDGRKFYSVVPPRFSPFSGLVRNHPFAKMNPISYKSSFEGHHYFNTGESPLFVCCTERFAKAMLDSGAIGYYFLSWAEGQTTHGWVRRDLSEASDKDLKSTLRKLKSEATRSTRL